MLVNHPAEQSNVVMSSEPPSAGFVRHADRIHYGIAYFVFKGSHVDFFIVMLFCHEDLF